MCTDDVPIQALSEAFHGLHRCTRTGRVEPFSCFDRTSYELYRIKKIAMFTFVLEYVFFFSYLFFDELSFNPAQNMPL